MNVGILLPGFSSGEDDWAIPVQHTLIRNMAERDDVRVLALRYPHRRDTYTIYKATVTSLGAGQVRAARRIALWWDALRTLRRLHREKPFDVLHAMWADETGLIASWAGRWLHVPVVVSIAGGELARLDDIGYGLQRSAFSRWIVGQALTRADAVIVACHYVEGLLAQAGYRVSASKIHRIPLGVDAALFRPGDGPPRPDHLVHAASLVKVKDQATLLRALALLDGVTLDIVGEGPERERLQALAAELGITGRVRFVGKVTHQDLPTYYQQAALNVLSSRHEGLGMVTLEAGACGVPTISTAVGLLPDEPALGMAVPVGDHKALAAQIRDLLDNADRWEALSRSARETILHRFTIEQTAAQFRALYTELRRSNT
jgi:glycosyltransferase involved in cell wall biosynthesis